MSNVSQVLHVLRKDLREHRWWFVLYLVFVAGALFAVSGRSGAGAALAGASIVLVMVGALCVAGAVQSDSPVDPTAFWGTRPFDPRAMLGAKIAAAVLLVIVGMVAQVAALSMMDAVSRDVDALVLTPAWTLFAWMAVFMVLAAVSGDLRTMVVGLLAVVVAVPLTFVALGDRATAFATASAGTIRVAAPLLAIAVAGWLYARRDGRLPLRIAAFAIAALLLSTLGARQVQVPAEPAAVSVPRVHGEVLLADSIAVAQGRAMLRLRLDPTPGWRFRMGRTAADLTLNDGSVVSTARRDDAFVFEGEVPEAGLYIADDSAWAKARRVGIRSAVVRGWLVPSEMRLVDTVPVRKGASASRDGVRVLIAGFEDARKRTGIAVRFAMVGRRRIPFNTLYGGPEMRFELLDRATGQRTPLRQLMSAATGMGMVLPGTEYQAYEALLVPAQLRIPSPSFDPAKLHDAVLIAYAEDQRGGYEITLSTRP